MRENDRTYPLLDAVRPVFLSQRRSWKVYWSYGHHGFDGLPPFQFNPLIYDYDWI